MTDELCNPTGPTQPQLRITPQEVATAYRETGLEPLMGISVRHKDNILCGGCALTALYSYSTGIKPPTFTPVRDWAKKIYGPNYIIGFVTGWDIVHECDISPDHRKLQKESAYTVGEKDGILALNHIRQIRGVQ